MKMEGLLFTEIDTMLLRLKEVVQSTRMTALELMIHLVSMLVFSVLIGTKVEGDLNVSWPVIFSPLFICDGLNAYLCVIIFVRQYREYELKQACLRLSNSLFVITLIFTFKLLLCKKLANGGLTCSDVIAPVLVLSHVFMFRAC